MSLSALLDHIITQEVYQEHNRLWTDAEIAFVRDNLALLGYDGVAAHLGRSINAVKIIQIRRRLPAPSKTPERYTMQQAAKILSVDIHALSKLERRGEIRFDIVPGERRIRIISRVALWTWAINPNHWLYFRPNRIRDARLRRLVLLRQAKWNDEWWSSGKAARYYGLAASNTIAMAISRGKLPAKKWGNWYVKKSDLMTYKFYAGKGNAQGKDYWSPRADAFILKARDEWGKTWLDIGRMMKWHHHRVAYRYRMLKPEDQGPSHPTPS